MNALREIVKDTYRGRLKAQLGDPERLSALYGSRFWRQPEVEKLRQFCITAAMTLNTKHSYVVLVMDDSIKIVAANDDEDPATYGLDWSVCPNVVGVGAALNIADAPNTPIICDIGSVAEGGVIAYLGVPLLSREGQILGSFCVVDYEERNWSEIDVAMLTQLASALISMHEAGGLHIGESSDSV